MARAYRRLEDPECLAYADYLRFNNVPFTRTVSEIPTRNFACLKRMKKEGWKAGEPDFLIWFPKNEFHGLCLEMKSLEGLFPYTDDAQYNTLLERAGMGYAAYCTRGAEAAIHVTEQYLQFGELVGSITKPTGMIRKPRHMVKCYNLILKELENAQ